VQQKLIDRRVSVISAGEAFGLEVERTQELARKYEAKYIESKARIIGVRISQRQQASERVGIVDGVVI
jgi:hypothetical protein